MYTYRKLTPAEQQEIVESRIKSGVPSHQPPHPATDAQHYLLTASCYEYKMVFSSPKRLQQLLDSFTGTSDHTSFTLLAWIFLPNHYHILAKVDDFKTLGPIFKKIHGRTAFQWNQEDDARGRKVWYRYSDRYIRNENHFYTTLNYIHFNPVKHGYVDSPYDWVWSSVHWYKQDKGVEWLRDLWSSFPLHDYGKGWDDL